MKENDNEGELGKKANDTAEDPAAELDQETETESDEEKKFTQSELDRILKKRLERAEKAWQEKLDLSEIDRLKKENEELKIEKARSLAQNSFQAAAEKQGVKNVKGLYKAIEADLEIDESGKIKNLDAAMKAAKGELPEFFGLSETGSADAAKGSASSAPSSMNDIIRSAFGRS